MIKGYARTVSDNGDVYEGFLENGKREGHGKLENLEKQYLYIGDWRNN